MLTPVDASPQTSIDFLIPSGVTRIVFLVNSVSPGGVSLFRLQIGTASGIENSGYTSDSGDTAGEATATDGFQITPTQGGTYVMIGVTVLELVNPALFTWSARGVHYNTGDNLPRWSVGVKSLSSELRRIRLTTAGGTEAFDAGSVALGYEF
jgi:hypothetical protein